MFDYQSTFGRYVMQHQMDCDNVAAELALMHHQGYNVNAESTQVAAFEKCGLDIGDFCASDFDYIAEVVRRKIGY